MEVERKFLVPDPPDLEDADAEEIDQGYLASGADGQVRLRRKGDAFVLTAKRGSGLSRRRRSWSSTEPPSSGSGR